VKNGYIQPIRTHLTASQPTVRAPEQRSLLTALPYASAPCCYMLQGAVHQ
jgi:hypothetical protein